MTQPEPDRLHARGLELWRGDRCLFRRLDLDVRAGELLHVRGRNGCGKTSLLRLLCGLAIAEQGEVFWNGTPTHQVRDAFHHALAYVGHHDGLHDDLTVIENLRWGIGLKREADSDTIDALLDEVGLGVARDVLSFGLSAGQRRRLALLRVAISAAPLWILDEPLANLDVQARDWCAERIAAHVAAGGLVIMTSHQDIALPENTTKVLEWSP